VSPETHEETQWTDTAKQAYQERADQLVEAIRAHVAFATARSGRQKEMGAYFDSADNVMEAAQAFNDAEFDWCGSSALSLLLEDEDDEDDDLDAGEPRPGNLLSVLGRWDFRITDESAAVAAGRRAYLSAWTADTAEDAEIRVQHVGDAAAELMHAHGLEAIGAAEGLAPERDTVVFLVHDGEEDDTFEDDPFAIAQD
jgi:hypothetical protein